MWESTFFVDFQGLWEERETALCFPLFPSGRHFHRDRRGAFRFVVRPIELTRVLLVGDLLAVGLHLRLTLYVLLRLDDRQCMSEALVLDDAVWLTR